MVLWRRGKPGFLGLILMGTLVVGAAPTAADTTREGLAWELVHHGTPWVIWTDGRVSVPLVVRNTGTVTWTPESLDHVAYHWRAADGHMVVLDGRRTELAHAVMPGEEIAVSARLISPPAPGTWVLEWAMVREQVRWYPAPEGGAANQVRVRVWPRIAVLQGGLLLGSIALLVLVWMLPEGVGRRALRAVGPILWAWGFTVTLTASFAELSGVVVETIIPGMGLSAAALAALPVALSPRRFRPAAAALVTLALSVLAVADLVYLRFFGNVVPPEAVLAWRQMGQIRESISSLMVSRDAWLVPGLLAGAVVAFGWPKVTPVWGVPRRDRFCFGVTVTVMLVALLPLACGLRAAWGDREIRDQVFDQHQTIARLGWLGAHTFEGVQATGERLLRRPLTEDEKGRIFEFAAGRHEWARAQDSGFGVARGANLILIQAESLHHWVIDARLGDQEITPFLNGLKDRGVFFSHVFDQSAQGRSSDGEFAALNAHHPLARGAVVFRRAGNRFVALPRLLGEAGYTTLSAHAFDRGFWNRAVVHPRIGFERSLFRREMGTGETIGWGLADGVFFERMMPHLAELPQPFFAFLITLGLHHPFAEFPPRHRVLDVGELEDSPLGNYLHAMRYLDACLEDLFAGLDGARLLENSVVAIYADHESGLRIDERVQHLARSGAWNAAARVRLRRVPFLAWLPEKTFSGEVPTLGGHIDIAPTLLHLLGIRPPFGFAGVPLVEGRPFPAVMADGSAVLGDVLLARSPDLPPDGLCYSFPAGERLERERCDDLDRLARAELWASRTVVDRDLAWDLARAGVP